MLNTQLRLSAVCYHQGKTRVPVYALCELMRSTFKQQADSCFNILNGVCVSTRWEKQVCFASVEMSAVSAPDLQLHSGHWRFDMWRSCNRSANGSSDLYREEWETAASVTAASLIVIGANKPHTEQEMKAWHFISHWQILCFISNHTETNNDNLGCTCAHTETCERQCTANQRANNYARMQLLLKYHQCVITLHTVISNVFWQLTYEQHTVKEKSAGALEAEDICEAKSASSSGSHMLETHFHFRFILREYERSGSVISCLQKLNIFIYNLCFFSVNTNSAVPLYRWWSCTSIPVCFDVSSWGGFASWVSPSCMAPSSSSCTGTLN